MRGQYPLGRRMPGPGGRGPLARADGNDELLAWCERIFEHIAGFATDFGWAPTDINTPEPGKHNESCEVCSLTDMVHLAPQLTDAGAGDHLDFIDTTIRNQMLEQQFGEPELLVAPGQAARSDQPLLPGLRGSVESRGLPNTLVGNPGGLEGCCTSALVRACYFARRRAAEDSGGRVWIHLPFSRASSKPDVLCHEARARLAWRRRATSTDVRPPGGPAPSANLTTHMRPEIRARAAGRRHQFFHARFQLAPASLPEARQLHDRPGVPPGSRERRGGHCGRPSGFLRCRHVASPQPPAPHRSQGGYLCACAVP
ncbi:MAG: hypothetical protein ABIF82_00845 [Planctomycetota bacterium]